MIALLVQASGRQRSEPVARHLLGGVAQSAKGRVNGIVAHRPRAAANRWEYVLAAPGEELQFPQERYRLLGKRDNVLLTHFHLVCRYPPLRFVGIQVKLGPIRMTQLAGPPKKLGSEF